MILLARQKMSFQDVRAGGFAIEEGGLGDLAGHGSQTRPGGAQTGKESTRINLVYYAGNQQDQQHSSEQSITIQDNIAEEACPSVGNRSVGGTRLWHFLGNHLDDPRGQSRRPQGMPDVGC